MRGDEKCDQSSSKKSGESVPLALESRKVEGGGSTVQYPPPSAARGNPRPVSMLSVESSINEEVNANTVSSRYSNLYLFENDGTNRLAVSEYLAAHRFGVSPSSQLSDSPATNADEDCLDASNGKLSSSYPPLINSETSQAATRNDLPLKNTPRTFGLGTFRGVFIPCFNSIIGIIIFLRLGYIVGLAGISQASLIAFLAILCILLTTLSLSAIATNGKIRSGGAYYMISRSLGKEVGGSVGFLFLLGQVFNVSLVCIGVAEIASKYMLPVTFGYNDPATAARLYGTIILVLITVLIFFRPDLVDQVEMLVFVCLCTALTSCFVGVFASGRPGTMNGVSSFPSAFVSNWPPHYKDPDVNGVVNNFDFFSLLGLFFPFVKGILSGSARSGDLEDAQYSIPRGTLSAHVLSSLIYFIFIIALGGTVDGALLRTENPSTGLLLAQLAWPTPWLPLVCCCIAGIGIAAQTFVRAPVLMHALAKDGILPFLHVLIPLTPVKGPQSNFWARLIPDAWPHRCLFVCFIIAEAIVLGGYFNVTASIVSLLYILMYMCVNLSTTLLSFMKEPSWRPTWHFYFWQLSALGACLCLCYMFLISWIISICSIIAVGILIFYISYSGAEVQWGDGLDSLYRSVALRTLLRLESEHHSFGTATGNVKGWKPQIIMLVKLDKDHTALSCENALSFVSQLKKAGGLTILASIIKGEVCELAHVVPDAVKLLESEMVKRRLHAFCEVLIAKAIPEGISSAIQSSGIGALRPNTVILGYPESWNRRTQMNDLKGRVADFMDAIRTVMALDKALLLVKGLSKFPVVKQKGTIDVYWVLHDGGILTLLPYLLLKHTVWKRCVLRVFAIAQMNDNSVLMKRDLAQTLKTLRIDAECDVLELGDELVDEFAIEKTMRMQDRQNLISRVERTRRGTVHMLNLPSISLANLAAVHGRVDEDDEGSDRLRFSRSGTRSGMLSPTGRMGRLSTILSASWANDATSSNSSASSTNGDRVSGAHKSHFPSTLSPKILEENEALEDAGIEIHVIPASPMKSSTISPLSDTEDLFPSSASGINDVITHPIGPSLALADVKIANPVLTPSPILPIPPLFTSNNPPSQTLADPLLPNPTPSNVKLNMMNTCVKLNHLMKTHSGNTSSCRLIFSNLPAPGKGDSAIPGLDFMEYLDTLMDGLDRVVLVKGTGMEVVTSFF